MDSSRIGLALVGCGYVADYYAQTLPLHPSLECVGVMDIDPERATRFGAYYGLPVLDTLDRVLDDPRIGIVVNLTNPRAHARVTRAALEAGRHVYSEKPLAMDFGEARSLVELAERKGLYLASAPCSLLGETAQTLWREVRRRRVGGIRLVYAELDDGMVHLAPYRGWLSASGAPWPARDEFEVGCTMEHAGYYLTWLAALFGPVESMTAFSRCLIPEKAAPSSLDPEDTPDFSVACLCFASGVTARLTCGIVAPHDHRLRLFGDDGVLSVNECWDYRSPVYAQRRVRIRRRSFVTPWRRRCPLAESGVRWRRRKGMAQMDFARGLAELAESIRDQRESRLSARFALHVTEVALAIQGAGQESGPRRIVTAFKPIEPMPWAR